MSDAPVVPNRKTESIARLREVALLFLRLGATAFGGPAAHISLMEDEVVTKRHWLSREEFLDLLGATNLIPGPNSTEMAIHLGYRRCGWPGLLVAGSCFILPAAIIVGTLAWAYVNFGALPQVAAILYFVKPVVIAVVVQAIWRLGASALKTRWLMAIGLASAVASYAGVNELLVLAVAAILTLFARVGRRKELSMSSWLCFFSGAASVPGAATAATVPFGLWPLFLFFLKVGSVLFGSGYVLLAFLRADLVERWHWLTDSQLLDAIVVGQVTPGPVFTTATFIGYVLAGTPGAVVATVGIFLPAFVFVAISHPIIPRLRRSVMAGALLDGVNVASLALMAVVTWRLAFDAFIDVPSIAFGLLSAVLLLRYKINSNWLILAGVVAGLLSVPLARIR